MYSPYTPPDEILSRMFKMYDSKSFFFSSVSMISRISACIADSASINFCKAVGERPGVPEATTWSSVFLVRFFIFFTSTHSYFFSGSFFSSPSFFSLLGLPSLSFLSLFALWGLPSAFSSAFSSASFFSSPSAGLASPSAGFSSAGISRFSLTISSTSSSSTICALSTAKMPCKFNLAFTWTFFAVSEAGISILNVPNSFGVPGNKDAGFSYSALTSKGAFL
mmetsp:Transcript_104148/g.301291  ORF Transcript_104148/g.301291 Transcript_104148/m.301291 type:complete len:222 (+) Transcript_104148:776-1441(+)